MKNNLEDFQKFKKIFSSPAMKQVIRWSKCVHGRVIGICILIVAMVLCSLGVTLVTKDLIDAAVSSRGDIMDRISVSSCSEAPWGLSV